MNNDPQETRAVLTARRQMHDVADAYVELEERLFGDGQRGGHSQPSSRTPLDAHAATVRMEISAWATFRARVLMDEVTVERYVGPPWAETVRVEPWAPPSSDPAAILHDIAENRIGHFLTDPVEAAEFLEECAEHAHRAHAAAWPSGARWIRLNVACPEYGTSDMGERVPCGGEYRMWMQPDQDVLGDMVCDRDRTHAITPADWQRAMRRRGVQDPNAAARLVRTIRLARGSVA